MLLIPGSELIQPQLEQMLLPFLPKVALTFWLSYSMSYYHRHLREIDCSLAVVGGPAAGAESRGKSIHWPCMWRQKVLHSGCCGRWHNYYGQQRQAGRANEQSTSLRCRWLLPIPQGSNHKGYQNYVYVKKNLTLLNDWTSSKNYKVFTEMHWQNFTIIIKRGCQFCAPNR